MRLRFLPGESKPGRWPASRDSSYPHSRSRRHPQSILYYLSEGTALAAERFLEAVQAAIEFLSRMPDAGSPKLLDNPLLSGLRSWPVKGFPAMRIYYIHSGDALRIIRVLHGKRDINPMLEEDAEDEAG